jgi:peptide-methionine (S)-S-oxide reductase
MLRRIPMILIAAFVALGSVAPAHAAQPARATAIFAGGCFWCMEPPFEKTKGVIAVYSGYTGGATREPSYEDVSSGRTGHYESLEVVYDPSKVTYQQLLNVYWHNVDPLDRTGQFCDKGDQYRSAIFVQNAEERKLAAASKLAQQLVLKKNIVTEILPAGKFYRAEEYHQDYYKKNPVRYKFYRFNCGRDSRLEQLWGNSH